MIQTNPVRVLNVLGTTNLGGAESRVMELYRALDRDKVQFDFLVHTDREGKYDEEIRELGGRIYSVPRFKLYNVLSYRAALRRFFQEHHEFAAVQGHMTSTAAIYLPIAKKAGVPVTIAHARSAGVDPGVKGLVTRLIRRPLKYRADYCFTCSAEAAKAIYGRKWIDQGKVQTIPDAIDVERFVYNPAVRAQVRAELGIADRFVIGHVGRFSFMKNHAYLIDIFAELCKMRDDAMLVLIGKGELEDEMKKKVNAEGLADKVLFLGSHFDVERYYQAFDYFVFPSIFEGLPGSVTEAQAAGLRCLVSNQITREVAMTELVTYKSISEPAANWASEIMRTASKALVREDMREAIAGKDFDVRRLAVKMEAFYTSGKNPPGAVTTVKKRIMLITPMLHQGGFERICVFTAKLLKDLYDVYLVVFTTKDMFYDVSGLNLIDLNLGSVEGRAGKIINIFKRVRRLKQLKKELDIDLTYSFGTTANIANVLSKGRDITWVGVRGYGALSDFGARMTFRMADCVVSCTKTMEAKIKEEFQPKRSYTLYNPCNLEEIRELAQREMDEKAEGSWKDFVDRSGALIASMGREDDLKGFWHLLKSFAVVRKEISDARLMIIGDGSYTEYRKLADDLGISDSVCFTGALKNPFSLLARADVYALTSLSEGFPNALIEAMACGLPCVSVNCMTGPAEILTEHYERYRDQSVVHEGEYGILTPVFEGSKSLDPSITDQEEQYARVIIDLLLDSAKMQDYHHKAVERADDFGVDRYLEKLVDMIEVM